MTIQEMLAEKFAFAADGTVDFREILRTIIEVVKDGDIDTEDYPLLVEAVKEMFAKVIPIINVPYMPDALEDKLFDSWAVPLAQSYADELVAGVFGAFKIPVKV